jgi:hypothetical protein
MNLVYPIGIKVKLRPKYFTGFLKNAEGITVGHGDCSYSPYCNWVHIRIKGFAYVLVCSSNSLLKLKNQ